MYAVSKTALLGLTKGLSAELGPQGIRVNCVAPGIVPTKFASYLVQDEALVSILMLSCEGLLLCPVCFSLYQVLLLQAKEQAEATNLKRLGRPEDMAAAVAFLSSSDASYVTGETLVIAGGSHSRL
jgi:dehydrogenase/reductase SDR family protein 4